MSVRILHLSDTHLRAPDASPPTVERATRDPEQRLRTVLAAVHTTGFTPDAVVHTGDIADDASAAACAMVRDYLLAVAPLVLAVPGNHDDPAAVLQVFGSCEAVVRGLRIVGADTTIPGASAGQADRVLRVLDACPTDLPTVVLAHHPLRSHSTAAMFQLQGAPAVEARLAVAGHVVAVLSGHTHEPWESTLGAHVQLLGAPACAYGLAHDGEATTHVDGTTGARLIEVDDRRVRSSLVLA